MKNILTNQYRQQLEFAYQNAKDKRTANKINILPLSDDGYSQSEVAAILRLDQSTIARHLKAYSTTGIKAYLKRSFSGGICQLKNHQIDKLGKYLDNFLCGSTDEVIFYVKSKFDVAYTRSGMSALLKRNGFVFKKPVLMPGKADTELQEAFVAYYMQIKASMGSRDKMYFLDGVHP